MSSYVLSVQLHFPILSYVLSVQLYFPMLSAAVSVELFFLNNPWQVSDALARLPDCCPEPGSRQRHGRQSCQSSCFW